MARWKDVKKGRVVPKSGASPKVHYAGFWSRFLALATDIFMIGMPIGLLIMLLFGYDTMQSQPGFMDAIEGTRPENRANPLIPLITLSLWVITVLSFWQTTGQTPGKKMARIVIVNSRDLKKPSFLQLAARLLFFIVPVFAFLSLIIMLFHPKKRTLHDLMSGTAVIYKA